MKKLLIIFLTILLIPFFEKDVLAYPSDMKKVFSFDNRNNKQVYLTFDDGYSYGNTKEIFHILREKGITATFFLTGDFMKDAKGLVKEMVECDMIIGNHTFSHKPITQMKKDELLLEIKQFEDLYKEITGKESLKYFRPPMGYYTEENLALLFGMGYKVFFWSNTYVDYDIKRKYSKEKTIKEILSKLNDGDIILLHTMNKTNIEALPTLIERIEAEGYTFKNLDSIG